MVLEIDNDQISNLQVQKEKLTVEYKELQRKLLYFEKIQTPVRVWMLKKYHCETISVFNLIHLLGVETFHELAKKSPRSGKEISREE